MTTIVNTPSSSDGTDSSFSFIALAVVIVLAMAFFVFIMPALRGGTSGGAQNGGTQNPGGQTNIQQMPKIPDKVDININTPKQ
jgi:hypothetical protein